MVYRTIEVRKLNPVIGAEIHGVDLSEDLGNQQFQEVHDALMENLVIFFRDQTMSVEQHKAFGRRFGKLHIHPNAPQELANHPEILVIKADENSKHVAGEDWHTDTPMMPEPPMGAILYALEAPPHGGDTLFANQYLAYEALSDGMKRLLADLRAVHSDRMVAGPAVRLNEQRSTKVRGPAPHRPPVATGHLDGTIRVWDTGSGDCLHVLYGHAKPPASVDLTDDGQPLWTEAERRDNDSPADPPVVSDQPERRTA